MKKQRQNRNAKAGSEVIEDRTLEADLALGALFGDGKGEGILVAWSPHFTLANPAATLSPAWPEFFLRTCTPPV